MVIEWGALFPARTVKVGEVFQRGLIYTLVIRNKSAELLENTAVLSLAPLEETSWQRVLETRSSRLNIIKSDAVGNRMVVNTLTLAPYATETVTIESTLEMSSLPKIVNDTSLKDALLSTKFIESDNPEIVVAASRLKRSSPRETAKAIFDFTLSHVKPIAYIRENRGALFAFQKREGDCTEFAYLFVALARANGIPARPLGGFIVGERSRLRAEGYRNWAEFFDGDTWRLVDPFMQVFDTTAEKYVAFRLLGTTEGEFDEMSQRFLSFDPRLEVTLD